MLSPHPTGDLPLLDGRRQQAGAPLSRRRRCLPRAAASAVRAAPLTDPVDAHGPLADVRTRVRHAQRAATGAAGAARKGHFRVRPFYIVRHFGGVLTLSTPRLVCVRGVTPVGAPRGAVRLRVVVARAPIFKENGPS